MLCCGSTLSTRNLLICPRICCSTSCPILAQPHGPECSTHPTQRGGAGDGDLPAQPWTGPSDRGLQQSRQEGSTQAPSEGLQRLDFCQCGDIWRARWGASCGCPLLVSCECDWSFALLQMWDCTTPSPLYQGGTFWCLEAALLPSTQSVVLSSWPWSHVFHTSL